MSHHTAAYITPKRIVLVVGQNHIGSGLEHTALEVLLRLQGVTLVVCSLHRSVLVGVADTVIIGAVLAATLYGEVVVLHQCRTEHDVLPVVVGL